MKNLPKATQGERQSRGVKMPRSVWCQKPQGWARVYLYATCPPGLPREDKAAPAASASPRVQELHAPRARPAMLRTWAGGVVGPSHGHGSLLDQGDAEVNQRTAPRLLGDASQEPPRGQGRAASRL